MRKLASIRKILDIQPIPNADAIEVATVDGWRVVVKKGEFAVGDLAVYSEVDSWIPHELAPFLSKGNEPREYNGVRGERLRTIRLRGQISQGLLLPLEPTCANIESLLFEGLDVSAPLNIQKWEAPVSARLAGVVKGNFPNQIPKTDQERAQNLVAEIRAAQGARFEITEKLDGSSMTCYVIDGEFGVCSRNLDLKEDPANAFWQVALELDIKSKMSNLGLDYLALQGELVGPSVQGNSYKLSKLNYYVFDVYDINRGEYLNPHERRSLVEKLGLEHVPVIDSAYVLNDDVEQLLTKAAGKSLLNSGTEREGFVFKQTNGGMTFKVISNSFLLGESH